MDLKYDEEINCPSYTVGSLIFKLYTKGVGGAFGGLQWPRMSFCKHFLSYLELCVIKEVSTLASNNIFSSSTACNSLVRFWMKLCACVYILKISSILTLYIWSMQGSGPFNPHARTSVAMQY